VLVGYLGYADQEIGTGYDLDSIAAAVVGGAVLGGGRGKISGTVAGILLMTALLNLVLILNLKVEYQLVVRGGVLLAAVAFYSSGWVEKLRGHRAGTASPRNPDRCACVEEKEVRTATRE
jgi:ribose/xylose/arabinose/galactoside ABC-type transport system permease subunit